MELIKNLNELILKWKVPIGNLYTQISIYIPDTKVGMASFMCTKILTVVLCLLPPSLNLSSHQDVPQPLNFLSVSQLSKAVLKTKQVNNNINKLHTA